MGRVRSLRIAGFRSIDDDVVIRVPPASPVVLVGENNAGKSNVVRALDLVLGETWPESFTPEEFDYFGRHKSGTITIETKLTDVEHSDRQTRGVVDSFVLQVSPGVDTRFS